MVIPLTDEAEWLARLSDVSALQPGEAPLVVIAPHPDDETLGAGGLIAAYRERLIPVTVIAVTDGENAYKNNDGLAAQRCEEQTRALACLGVAAENIVRLGLTDSSVAGQEVELAQALRPYVSAHTQMLAPWRGDFHPDHEACARAAAKVAEETGACLMSYFFWTWHRGVPAVLDGLELRKFTLTQAQMRARQTALACHRSQLVHAPEAEILPEALLWPARLPFEVFAL